MPTCASTSTWKGCAKGAPDPGGPTKSQHFTSSSDSVVCPRDMAVLPTSLRGLFFAYSVGSGGGAKSGVLCISCAGWDTGFCALVSVGARFWRLLGGTCAAAACWLAPSDAALQFSFSGWSVPAGTGQKPANAALPDACKSVEEAIVSNAAPQNACKTCRCLARFDVVICYAT